MVMAESNYYNYYVLTKYQYISSTEKQISALLIEAQIVISNQVNDYCPDPLG